MKQRLLQRIVLYIGLSVAALTFIYPFLWMASSTFKPALEVGSLALIPHDATLRSARPQLSLRISLTRSAIGCRSP